MPLRIDRPDARSTCRWLAVLALACSALPGSAPDASADELSPKQRDLFEVRARPTFVAHCLQCHGDTKQENGLRLTTRADLLRGGESGPAIVPGKPDESLLLEALRHESLEMPPDGRLEAELIAGVAEWIAAGAPWPEGVQLRPAPDKLKLDRDWWSLQPIRDPATPSVVNDEWCRNDIDRFLLASLESAGLQPAPQADPRTLRRRMHFAVIGLPPGEDSDQQSAGQSLDELLDQLLDDPGYGVNQARFWLDLVRYADSDGYNADHARPDAHLYRDYVVRSFNSDKPYDRFVTEQLAGDEIDPGSRDALIATMFLRHWIYEWNQRDVEGQWQEILNDVTETTSDVFLATGLKCARCHDHKFDPLLQKDYFRLQAFFAALHPRDEMPLGTLEQRAAHFEKQRAWEAATDEIRKRLHAIERPVLLQHATREGFVKFVPEIRSMITKRDCDREPYEHQIASLAARQFDVHPDKLAEWLDKEALAEREALLKRLAEFDPMKPEPLPTAPFLASDVGPVAPPTHVLDDPGRTPVAPGFPTVLDPRPATIVPPPEALQSTGRRTALAKWITDPANPLTARVIVNRVWQQHFGRGLVETASDFGRLGRPPSHPELLDWLASRFIEDGWSLKRLHRRILRSAAWRQRADRPLDDLLRERDPGCRLLWRMSPRRLSAEEIVDSIVSASGELTELKRALYRPVKRNHPDPQLGLFDFPGRNRSSGQRHRTTTSTQALMLLNNAWSHERAAAMARRLEKLDDRELVDAAYRQLYFRSPSEDEQALARDFLASYAALVPALERSELLAELPDGAPAVRLDPKRPTPIRIGWSERLPSGPFTVQATVLLQSLYDDASVRTIAAHWSGDKQDLGWALGVTSTKSAYKPRNLILQIVGRGADGKPAYEVAASNLRLELGKPYFVAVSVTPNDASDAGVQFYVKELTDENAKLQTARVAHRAVEALRPERPLEIGGRSQKHLWDGLIHSVRLHGVALSSEQIAAGASEAVVFDVRFAAGAPLGADVSGNDLHAEVDDRAARPPTPRQRSRAALLHALLNSNELIYVD